MKFTLAFLAAVGFASALPEPFANPPKGYGKTTTECHHTSTCKAVYATKTQIITKPVHVTVVSKARGPRLRTGSSRSMCLGSVQDLT